MSAACNQKQGSRCIRSSLPAPPRALLARCEWVGLGGRLQQRGPVHDSRAPAPPRSCLAPSKTFERHRGGAPRRFRFSRNGYAFAGCANSDPGAALPLPPGWALVANSSVEQDVGPPLPQLWVLRNEASNQLLLVVRATVGASEWGANFMYTLAPDATGMFGGNLSTGFLGVFQQARWGECAGSDVCGCGRAGLGGGRMSLGGKGASGGGPDGMLCSGGSGGAARMPRRVCRSPPWAPNLHPQHAAAPKNTAAPHPTQIWPTAQEALAELAANATAGSTPQVYVTGHSMGAGVGGMVAYAAAQYLQEEMGNEVGQVPGALTGHWARQGAEQRRAAPLPNVALGSCAVAACSRLPPRQPADCPGAWLCGGVASCLALSPASPPHPLHARRPPGSMASFFLPPRSATTRLWRNTTPWSTLATSVRAAAACCWGPAFSR